MAQGSLTPLILTAPLFYCGSFQAPLAGPPEPPGHTASPKKPGTKIKDKETTSKGTVGFSNTGIVREQSLKVMTEETCLSPPVKCTPTAQPSFGAHRLLCESAMHPHLEDEAETEGRSLLPVRPAVCNAGCGSPEGSFILVRALILQRRKMILPPNCQSAAASPWPNLQPSF